MKVIILTQLLSDLDLDEVSLVGKAANGKKKFLIFKSQERVTKMTPPAPENKADNIQKAVDDAVRKAMRAEQHKTEAIRKELNVEKAKRRRAELADIAKNKLDAFGPVEKTTDILKALEDSDMALDQKKQIIATMVQANEIKKTSAMFESFGSNRPEPGTPTAKFEALVAEEEARIRKSETGSNDPKVRKALAEDQVSKEHPDLARAVIAEENAAVMRQSMGVN